MSLLKTTIVNPKNLGKKEFERLNEVTQDLWWESFWEFAQCNCCNHMISKSEYFKNKTWNIRETTIKKLMHTLSLTEKDIRCTKCNWSTTIIFWEEYSHHQFEKYMKKKCALVIANNENWEIVWFSEWYLWTLKYIYEEELKVRYQNFWMKWLEREIESKIGFVPNDFLIISWVWILPEYKSWYNLFNLMKSLNSQLKNILDWNFWLAENDCKHIMEKITRLYWIKLEFDRSKITNINESYNSQLYVIPDIWNAFSQLFSWSIKDFIKIKQRKC